MRFGLIHRIMTDALAALGLLSLVTSGELDPAVSGAIVIGLVAAIAIPERWQDRTPLRQFSVAAPILLLVTQAVRLFLGAEVLQLAVEFAAALQIVRLATRRGAAHDQQVIVLALLHLIAGTVLGTGLAYGLCFFGFLVVAPGALVLSHLRREVEGNYRQGARDRTGLPVDVPRILRSRRVIGRQFLISTCLLSLPIFIFTIMVFLLFPRVGLSLLLFNRARPERMVGFSDKVDLGGVGKLRSDPTIAMRVEYPNLTDPPQPRLGLYLRGTGFDQYDGRSWSRSNTRRLPATKRGDEVILRRAPRPTDTKLTIELEPIDPPVVFIPPNTVALRVLSDADSVGVPQPAIFRGPEDELKYHSKDERGIRYEVWTAASPESLGPLSARERQRYLTLPELPPRIAQLAASWVGGETDPEAKAKLIEARLQKYQYDLNSPSGAADNPLDHFLFESKAGHCEYYSTAMAVLLRTQGVPARNVTGFIGGTYNRFGNYYAVRQGDAHSWVEVYLDGKGWTRFDPTPPGEVISQTDVNSFLSNIRDFVEAAAQRWNRNVVGYDLQQQLGLLHSVQDGYGNLRGKSSLLRALDSPRRLIFVALGGGMLVVATVLWRRRRRNRSTQSKKRGKREVETQRAVALYEAVDQALAARGAARPASTPPLHHAKALLRLKHPIAEEVLALTEIYLEARFGGRSLSAEERRDFAARARRLKTPEEKQAA